MNTEMISTNLLEDNVLSGIIIVLVIVLVYLFFFREESEPTDESTDKVNESDDNENLLDSNDPYTVSVGNPKLITRCKPINSVTKNVEKIDYSFKPTYIPNSRGNVCDKELDSSALFPSMSDENVLENIDSEGSPVLPVSSFSGDEAPFVANCSFQTPDCTTNTTMFPGEILMKEGIPVGSMEAPKETVENYVNYYEGYSDDIEGLEKDNEPEKEKIECVMYYADWCPHCQSAKPEWDEFKSDVGSVRNGHNVVIKKVECEKEKDVCKAAKVEGYPTIIFKCGDKVQHYEKERTKNGFLSFLDDFIKSLGGN